MSKRRNAIAENWVAYLCSMIESPAMRVLSQSAIRVMHRLEIEHMRHGGAENGRLIVTYDQFEEWGVSRHSIGPAIRELVALGLVEITEKGCAGNDKDHKATQHRLTYVNSKTREQPTNEWLKVKTMKEAEALAAAARAEKSEQARALGKRGYKARAKKHFPVTTTVTGASDNNRHRKRNFPVTTVVTTGPVTTDVTTIYISGRRSDSVGPDPATIASQPAKPAWTKPVVRAVGVDTITVQRNRQYDQLRPEQRKCK